MSDLDLRLSNNSGMVSCLKILWATFTPKMLQDAQGGGMLPFGYVREGALLSKFLIDTREISQFDGVTLSIGFLPPPYTTPTMLHGVIGYFGLLGTTADDYIDERFVSPDSWLFLQVNGNFTQGPDGPLHLGLVADFFMSHDAAYLGVTR